MRSNGQSRADQRHTRQFAYDHSEADRARHRRYNRSEKGRLRNLRHNAKRREDPKYDDYRANKLVWDRRNHFFRYGVLMDQKMTRFPWLRNKYSARQLFTRMTGIDVVTGAIDFTQPRRNKLGKYRIKSAPQSALGVYSRLTGLKVN